MLDAYYKRLRDAQYKLQPILREEDIDIIFGEEVLRAPRHKQISQEEQHLDDTATSVCGEPWSITKSSRHHGCMHR
jgi:hypothetical protein